MRRSCFLSLVVACLAGIPASAGAGPLILPAPVFRAGATAGLEVVAPDHAHSCALSLRGGGRRLGPYRVALGGPTRLVRWRVSDAARGSWHARLACRGARSRAARRGPALGAASATVTVGRRGPPRGRLVAPGTLRVVRGSIPEMPPRPPVRARLAAPVKLDDTREGYRFETCPGSTWMSRTRTLGDGVATEVQLVPTLAAVAHAELALGDAISLRLTGSERWIVYRQMWADLDRCHAIPAGLTGDELHSLYMQMACHARYGFVGAGNTWDFEAWRENVDWSVAINPLNRCQSGAWGIDDPDVPPVSTYVAGLQNRLVHSSGDTHDPPRSWLVSGHATSEVESQEAYDCLVRAGWPPATVVYPLDFFLKYVREVGPMVRAENVCLQTLPGRDGSAPLPLQPTDPPPPQPAAPSSSRYYVYGTCADGACGLRKRSGPGYSSYAIVGMLADGDPVDIACQTTGELVTPNDGTASNVWDRLVDGAYVTDVYITTPAVGGAFTAGLPRC
jgi:hypothetical protein